MKDERWAYLRVRMMMTKEKKPRLPDENCYPSSLERFSLRVVNVWYLGRYSSRQQVSQFASPSFILFFSFFSFYHSLLRTTLPFFHHHHITPNQIQNQKEKSSIQNLQSLVQANKILSRRDSSSAFSSSSFLFFFLEIAIFTIQDISALPSKNLPSLSKLNSHYSYDLITNAYKKSVSEI